VTIKRACPTCGKPGPKSYCDKHKPITRRIKLGISGSAEQARRLRILEIYRYRCYVCGKQGDASELEVDHVVPLNEGGEDHERNLKPIHKDEHLAKSVAEKARARKRNNR
jgi:5-methylcytosine-specific restriction endonuclease McrA